MLEGEDHMPIKYISKDLRKQLQKEIPGLRPWEVLSIEQANDQIAYDRIWYRERFGSYATCPPYLRNWNKDVKVRCCGTMVIYCAGSSLLWNRLVIYLE
ncbi:hypothetical protein MKW98_027293 [Papaver atlanticum]|uniref:Uncharacterized protein n=1 Tax=Papaver atlanticum TaxID=357466 RepID=A0AAD4SR98_9MAGN|nr:hypothetical protein MKW98_027293 [Papaver atlanticum]